MMKKLLIALLALPSIALAKEDEPVANKKAAVQNCGEYSECNQYVLNAIGQSAKFTIPADKIVALGTIVADKEVTVVLPKVPGTQTAYSFKPSAGNSRNQLVTVLFDNKVQRPGERNFGKTEIKVYRRLPQDPVIKWTEIGNILYPGSIEKDYQGPYDVKITVKPDGTAVYWNPHEKKPMVFLAGTKDLSAAAAAEKAATTQAA
jgi:hypothetical protein